MKHYNGAANFVKPMGQLMVLLEDLQFDTKFFACKMVLNNCFSMQFLNAALNRFDVVFVVYRCLYIEVMYMCIFSMPYYV